MNYGRKKASQKRKKITSKSTMQNRRLGVRLFKAFLLCILVVGLVGVIGVGIFAKRIIDRTPDVSAADIKPKGFTTFVYADDGATETARFVTSGSNRVYKTLDEIPAYLQHAFVAIEDERFYKHNGIDLQGIARAAFVGITSGDFSEGASTITQQLIKNNVFPNFVNEKTFYDSLERKLQEQVLALEIEKKLDKNTILESYMNTINLGQNSLGVQSASKRYFNKDVSELTLSECAVIAGIIQNPTGYNPITNPEQNQKRQHIVLKYMLDQGYITQEEYDAALADDVYARIQNVNTITSVESPYTYFVDALSEQVIHDLQEQLGYTETQAYNAVYSGGLSIYSTQNLAMQQICDEEINNDANYPRLKEYGLDYALTVTRANGTAENYGSQDIKRFVKATYGSEQGLVYSTEEAARGMIEQWKATIAQEGDTYDEVVNLSPQPQASLTLMDQSTGYIKAMVGGRGTKATSLALNRAYTGSKRQPGSCFKILAAYAPALDSKGKTLATVVRDEPYKLTNGKTLRNAEGTYGGDTTIRRAIAKSTNVVAVKVSDEITQQLGFSYCEKFGITTLVKKKEINGGIYSDISQTLSLGGITDGIYNFELCAAYAAIANGGVYHSPTLYSKILDHDGAVLLENVGETRTVIKDSTAALLTSAMEDVVTSGTGYGFKLPNMPVAGKTGTTSDNKDIWFCGYTPYYTCAVWAGYDDNKELSGDTYFHSRIWSSVMRRVHAGLQTKQFTMPTSVERKSVCATTGKLPTNGCPVITEYFAKDSLPTQYCPVHKGGSSDDDDEDDDSDDRNTNNTNNANTNNTNDNGNAPDPEPDQPEPDPEPAP